MERMLLLLLLFSALLFIVIKLKEHSYYITLGAVVLLLLFGTINVRDDIHYVFNGGAHKKISIETIRRYTKSRKIIIDTEGNYYYISKHWDTELRLDYVGKNKEVDINYLPKSRTVFSIYYNNRLIYNILDSFLFYMFAIIFLVISIVLFRAIETDWFFKIAKRK